MYRTEHKLESKQARYVLAQVIEALELIEAEKADMLTGVRKHTENFDNIMKFVSKHNKAWCLMINEMIAEVHTTEAK